MSQDSSRAPPKSFRRHVYELMDPRARANGLSWLNQLLAVAILLSVATIVLETEPTVSAGREHVFRMAEVGFASLFAVEFVGRFWAAAEAGGWEARRRWLFSVAAFTDLIAIAPVLLLAGAGPAPLLRVLRLVRLLRLAKLGRFSRAWSLIAEAVGSRRYELGLTLAAAIGTMLVTSTLLYIVEGPGQPEKFGSIPRALWWSAVTLTTIGYGDVYPITPLGRLLAAGTAIIGIGLIAAPTGILAAAFSEALQHRRLAESAPGEEEKSEDDRPAPKPVEGRLTLRAPEA